MRGRGKKKPKTQATKLPVFDITWESFLGGLCMMTIALSSFEDLEEVAKLLKRPILRDRRRKKFYVLDRTTLYVYSER